MDFQQSQCLLERVFVSTRNQRINEQIRISPVRVISADGELLGILNTDEALTRRLAKPIWIWSKWRPTSGRRSAGSWTTASSSTSRRSGRPKATRTRARSRKSAFAPKRASTTSASSSTRPARFLQHKDKVIVSVIFRGRELAHVEEGRKVIDHVIKELEDVGKIESPLAPGQADRGILAPK